LVKSTSYETSHYASHLSLHPLRSKYPSQHPILKHPPPFISETKFHTHKQPQVKIVLLYNLTFPFLDSRREDKRFWTEW
jgi:hypothetical protein